MPKSTASRKTIERESIQKEDYDAPWSALFAGEMAPYKAPASSLMRYFWSWRLCFEATFAFTMLDPWEKGLLSEFIHDILARSSSSPYLFIAPFVLVSPRRSRGLGSKLCRMFL